MGNPANNLLPPQRPHILLAQFLIILPNSSAQGKLWGVIKQELSAPQCRHMARGWNHPAMPGILQSRIPASEAEETLKPSETSLSTLLCLASSSQQLLGLFFYLLRPAIKI